MQYTLTGTAQTRTGTSVASTLAVAPGTWTCAYVSGGPGSAYLADIAPSLTQVLARSNFVS